MSDLPITLHKGILIVLCVALYKREWALRSVGGRSAREGHWSCYKSVLTLISVRCGYSPHPNLVWAVFLGYYNYTFFGCRHFFQRNTPGRGTYKISRPKIRRKETFVVGKHGRGDLSDGDHDNPSLKHSQTDDEKLSMQSQCLSTRLHRGSNILQKRTLPWR